MTKDDRKKKRNYTLRLNDELHEKLESMASKQDTTKTQIIKNAINQYISR